MKNMRHLILICAFLLSTSVPSVSKAQPMLNEGRQGEITRTPVCGYLINASDHTILGSIATMEAETPAGEVSRFQDNFRLAAGEKIPVCSSGPFYQGRRLELTIRTLIPLFECYTRFDRDILLRADRDENGILKLSADCY